MTLDDRPAMWVSATVLGAVDPPALAEFYGRLLGWEVATVDPTWVTLRPPAGGTDLSFQWEPDLQPPPWPSAADEASMTSHLDIAVDDLDAAVAHALAVGAVLADHQPQDNVRVMVDPSGHRFCLFPAPTPDDG